MDFLHNHSLFSDGGNTIGEMAQCAKELGVTRFGISDHLVMIPEQWSSVCDWTMSKEQLPGYVAEAQRLQQQLNDSAFQMLIGVELDFFTENFDDILSVVRGYPFDYVIGALHYVDDFHIDSDRENWQRLTPAERTGVWESYLDRLMAIATLGERQYCTFLAHLDLPKIFGYDLPAELHGKMEEVLKAIAAAGLGIEINLAGRDKFCHREYPDEWIRIRALELGIPMVVNGDCHSCGQLRRRFAVAKNYPIGGMSVG